MPLGCRLGEDDSSSHNRIVIHTDRSHQQRDAVLIRRVLKGDDQAWAVLLERYSGLIYSIALKCHLPPEDAADVFQSVCLTMLEGLEKLRDRSKLSSWLTTITLRQCQRAKRQERLHLVDLDRADTTLTDFPDNSLLPDEVLQKLEQERLVRQAVSMLDEACQRLVTLLFYEDEAWSYGKIAREIGLSDATVGCKRRRCLKRLKSILDRLGFFAPWSPTGNGNKRNGNLL